MKRIKYFIVWFLEASCEYTHWLTWRRFWANFWSKHNMPFGLGWHCPLADLSARLDERWNTGVWKEV